MTPTMLAWLAFGTYALVTAGLALIGMKKTQTLAGFALGNGDLGPVVTGVTLAAAIASTATFVINPGFVYAHGISALLHLGVASFSGVLVGLVVLSKGFRTRGMADGALTLPHWIGARYGHRPMRTYFAVLNLVAAVTFVVLIVKGSALVMQHTLHLGYVTSLLVIVGFVFSYILMGGTYAHVFTNAFQGALMVVVAIAIVLSGAHLFSDGFGVFFERVGAIDPNLLAPVNPTSPLFGDTFTVFVAGFVVGLALVAQPHILTKSLYLRSDRDVPKYLGVAAVVCVVYTGVLLAGLYARVALPALDAQDAVMPAYLANAFSPMVGVLISVALLAAGMSTLDGILVSASTIAANDVFLPLAEKRLPDEETRQKVALKASRIILIAMGVVAFGLALDPPKLVGIFAQVGIYGLVAASLAPIACGILANPKGTDVFAASIVAPLVHVAVYGSIVWVGGGILNPAVSATIGIVSAFILLGTISFVRHTAGREQFAGLGAKR